jgi:hypothetical protein
MSDSGITQDKGNDYVAVVANGKLPAPGEESSRNKDNQNEDTNEQRKDLIIQDWII